MIEAIKSYMLFFRLDMQNQEKYKLIKRLLLDEYVIIQINTSVNGLHLPDILLKDHSVSLKLSLMFKGPIFITEEKIEANLSFNQVYFQCEIPLEAVWSATSVKNEFTVWPESAPVKHLKSIIENANKSTEEKHPEATPVKTETATTEKKKPSLKRIK